LAQQLHPVQPRDNTAHFGLGYQLSHARHSPPPAERPFRLGSAGLPVVAIEKSKGRPPQELAAAHAQSGFADVPVEGFPLRRSETYRDAGALFAHAGQYSPPPQPLPSGAPKSTSFHALAAGKMNANWL